ncbi:hypothetical protein HPB51_017127 [Rhipicephalus microplus]|uniref:Uncharacterized protein n=1 Tax=Rhipicephalus microplus TaxID=6941 RepID=A0A9J6ENI6_RHIMP|nr:hypothetical protein HPB51_017127 [Rhipicephalus microplus]
MNVVRAVSGRIRVLFHRAAPALHILWRHPSGHRTSRSSLATRASAAIEVRAQSARPMTLREAFALVRKNPTAQNAVTREGVSYAAATGGSTAHASTSTTTTPENASAISVLAAAVLAALDFLPLDCPVRPLCIAALATQQALRQHGLLIVNTSWPTFAHRGVKNSAIDISHVSDECQYERKREADTWGSDHYPLYLEPLDRSHAGTGTYTVADWPRFRQLSAASPPYGVAYFSYVARCVEAASHVHRASGNTTFPHKTSQSTRGLPEAPVPCDQKRPQGALDTL